MALVPASLAEGGHWSFDCDSMVKPCEERNAQEPELPRLPHPALEDALTCINLHKVHTAMGSENADKFLHGKDLGVGRLGREKVWQCICMGR